MIMLEIFKPENTATELNMLYEELDMELNSVKSELDNLHIIAAPAVQKRIIEILPLVERYRTETKIIINDMLSIGFIDLDNPAYRDALEKAQNDSRRVSSEFGDDLYQQLGEIPTMALNVLKQLGEDNAAEVKTVQIISMLILGIMALFIISLALYISNLISKPLNLLSTFMKRAGTTGDIHLSRDDEETIYRYAHIKDEIGEAINGSAAFVGHVMNISKELESVAEGNLTTEAKPLSSADVMGLSLEKMIDNLNSVFTNIQESSSEVSSASKQVAEGAQYLAQGSTTQAASIEELSSSIDDIAERTKANAEIAEKTSKLSNIIKESAEKGSRQMDEMILAVKDINEASYSIGKIIKTIDDIAFQTNILALNAAVEAARAGQHGKGFAVVAEEVRNLASKSAEAARDTSDIIQNSIDKAEFGSRIAGETALSLKEIVTGINESSQLISEIAKGSEDQSVGIEQINVGIDQVAQVVQQNSATSEESAAASEEMSGQSDMLREMISQFKLRR